MAILESCCGCSLAISSAVLGVYLLVAYAIAFAIELWWILESPATPPIPAYLLCLEYFILLAFSALLLHGLSAKKTTFLLIWLFMMGILLGPEAGLVLYLSIHHWRVTSLYGLIEVTCWACRLVINAVGLLSVQSLNSAWRDEKFMLSRLETLKTCPLSKVQRQRLTMTSIFRDHKITGCEKNDIRRSDVPLKGRHTEVDEVLQLPHKEINSNDENFERSYLTSGFDPKNAFSEFNASSFDPTIIDAHLQNMPFLTIRKKPKQITGIKDLIFKEKRIISRAHSLIDFRDSELTGLENTNCAKECESQSSSILEKDSEKTRHPEINTNSLDRKFKNKNFKILKNVSPFYSRKPSEINIYHINPPAIFSSSTLDSQLNKIYCSRGMYKFDEKLKKAVYYPPEIFNESQKFRSRMDSYNSSQSRSSVDTDSEDIKHIRDVAL